VTQPDNGRHWLCVAGDPDAIRPLHVRLCWARALALTERSSPDSAGIIPSTTRPPPAATNSGRRRPATASGFDSEASHVGIGVPSYPSGIERTPNRV
jgi:hypothetical protein